RAAELGLPAQAFEQGMIKVDWPARMQRLAAGALAARAPAGSELWLDGGHNAEGGRIVAGALADMEERVSRPLVLIVGMLSTKDHEGFLGNFAGLARALIAVPIGQGSGLAPDVLAAAARQIGIAAQSAGSVEDALAAAGELGLEPPPRILVTGSLYLAGAVLGANGTPPG
ncbi:MAG TPA: bifunctional folylpolyglutamate synthase/dihydrofolate synthase, partial [Xanthobacteraceae bacterium]|nr:bifunctional folylpolyglutamate synthase/dihydrofolate synthase [Xanthobacteraceae bacterium]